MNINSSTLPDDSAELKQMLTDFQKHHDKETDLLLEEIRHLRAQLFGRKSEKGGSEGGPFPLPLFDMPEPVEEEEGEADIHVPAHSRKKRGRKPLPEDLPRIEVIHDIDSVDKICGCGSELSRIGEEVSEQLDIVPAKIQVIRHIRPKYACRSCEGVEDDGPTVRIAPPPTQLIPKSIATSGLLAYILTGKFIDHTPFYRQEKQFLRLGVEISRTSMCNWAMQVAEICRPLLHLLTDEVLSGSYINVDETTLQVLRESGRDPTSTSYMWIFRRGDPEKTVLIYQYHPSRSGDVAREFLRDFEGYVQTDGYKGYDFLDNNKNVRHIGCLAHARRKFMDVVKAQGKNRKAGSADVALSYIKKLYMLEREARKQSYSIEQIHQMRQEKSRPIMDNFLKWLQKKSGTTPPKGLLGKAISYTLKQWDRLIGYLEDGRLSPDNNMAENSIRPFVIGRKNWIFSGTAKGAEASALLYSLIETAKVNGLEPYAYLRYVFEQIPIAATLEDYERLLPWNIAADQIGCSLQPLECA
jgi:transposase